MKGKGFLICIEGLDGCGKTTQAKLLAKRLKESYNAVYTAEPTQGKVGKFIKENYLHGERRGSSIVEALLFAADRYEHVKDEIAPAVREGRVVISDRYLYSSLAYQGASGLDLEWIRQINKHAMLPDLGILLDVAPETVVRRLKTCLSVMENLETQRSVRKVYSKLVDNGELVKIDGNESKDEVAYKVFRIALGFLEKAC